MDQSPRYLEEWCRACALHGYLQLDWVAGPPQERAWDSGMEVRGTETFALR